MSHVLLQKSPKGDVIVWEEPIPEAQYLLGADVAQGATFGAASERGDYSAWCVLKRNGMELVQVAEGRTKYDNFTVGEMIAAIGNWYNQSWINVERNLAHGVIAGLRAANYPIEKWYVPPVFNSIKEDQESRYFFHKNSATGKVLVDTLIAYLNPEQPRLIIRSHKLLAELSSLQRDSQGRVDTGGRDLSIALMMAVIIDATSDLPMPVKRVQVEQPKHPRWNEDPELFYERQRKDEHKLSLPEEPPQWSGGSLDVDDDPYPVFTEDYSF